MRVFMGQLKGLTFSGLTGATLLLCTGLAQAQSAPATNQASANPLQADAQDMRCILAGRLDSGQRWAPQARGIELLDGAGKRISAPGKDALAATRQVRVSSPALLSSCNGSQPLAQGDDTANARKPTVPAISAGAAPLEVEAVNFPPLRVGGELVELRVNLGADRVVSLTR